MKNFAKKYILPNASAILNIPLWIKLTGQKIIHVFYHTVSDEYLPHINPLYKPKTAKEFKNDMDCLLKYFAPIGINDVLKQVTKEKQIEKPSFHISFDDGLSEVRRIIAPILYQKGIPATVFINSGFVDNNALFYRHKAAVLIDKMNSSDISPAKNCQVETILNVAKIKGNNLKERLLHIDYSQKTILNDIASVLDVDFDVFLKNQRPYLTVEELKELQHKGFTIGAHGIDHPNFTLLNEDEQIRQTEDSIQFVQQHLQEKNRYFAFPFSDLNVSPAFFAYLNSLVDISFGSSVINTEQDSKHIQRIELEATKLSVKKRIKYCYLINFITKKQNRLRLH